MMKSGFFCVFQHGFTKWESCTTNLLTAFETWMDGGYEVMKVMELSVDIIGAELGPSCRLPTASPGCG